MLSGNLVVLRNGLGWRDALLLAIALPAAVIFWLSLCVWRLANDAPIACLT